MTDVPVIQKIIPQHDFRTMVPASVVLSLYDQCIPYRCAAVYIESANLSALNAYVQLAYKSDSAQTHWKYGTAQVLNTANALYSLKDPDLTCTILGLNIAKVGVVIGTLNIWVILYKKLGLSLTATGGSSSSPKRETYTGSAGYVITTSSTLTQFINLYIKTQWKDPAFYSYVVGSNTITLLNSPLVGGEVIYVEFY